MNLFSSKSYSLLVPEEWQLHFHEVGDDTLLVYFKSTFMGVVSKDSLTMTISCPRLGVPRTIISVADPDLFAKLRDLITIAEKANPG